MSNADIRGRFVWHELMTTDTKAASAFYSKVAGWRTQAWDKDPTYTLWVSAKGGPFGGVRTLSDAARAAGPHWLAYIGTDDLDATVQTAQHLGARVTMGATDIPDAGRMAVLADPQGAAFALYSSAGAASQSSSNSPPSQEFSWHELSTSEPAAALRFYTELFGWAEVGKHDMGAMGVYHLLGLQGVPSIGMFKIPADKPMPTQWMCYAHVADVDRSANGGKAAGGKLLNGPMEVPGGTWIAHLMDPQGAMFAIHADKRAAAATSAAQPAKAPAPRTAASPSAPKSTPASMTSPANAAAPTAKPAKLTTATTGAGRSATPPKGGAPRKTPAKKAAAKKAPAKAAVKRAARKATKKKAVAKRRPKRRSSAAAKRSTRKSATKRKATRKRGKAGRRRSAAGGFTVGSLLRRLRGRKRR